MAPTLAIAEAAFHLERRSDVWLAGLREAARQAVPCARAVQATQFPGRDGLAALDALFGPCDRAAATAITGSADGWCMLVSEAFAEGPSAELIDTWQAEGIGDYLALFASDGEHGILLAIGLPKSFQLTPARRAAFARVADELRAAMGVRRRLRQDRSGKHPRVRLAPQEPAATDTPAAAPCLDSDAEHRGRMREHLLRRGRPADRGPETPTLSWESLMEGAWMILDQFDRDGKRTLAVLPRPGGSALRRLDDRERSMARMAGDALSNKRIALELGLSEPCVARTLDTVMVKLGLRQRPDLVRLRCLLAERDVSVTATAS